MVRGANDRDRSLAARSNGRGDGMRYAQHIDMRIAVLVGSLRKDSYNRKLARAAMELAPDSVGCELIEIGNLPLYNPDLEGPDRPRAWTALRAKLHEADAVLFVTPEYNRSVPGLLKNAIDVGSRPNGESGFDRKPAAIISSSPGALGAFGANHHLRQMLVFLNMPTLLQPEVYIGKVADRFDDDGTLVDDSTRDLVWQFMDAFADWISLHARQRTSESAT
jgi:chromate reductase